MPTVADFGNKLLRTSQALKAAAPRAVNAGAAVVKASVDAEISAVTTGSYLRGVGRSGATVGTKILPARSTVRPVAGIVGTGPLWLIERDVKPHKMPAPGSRRKRPYRTPEGPRRSISHPGSRGKHPFERGVTRSRAAAALAMRRVIDDTIRRNLR